MYGVVVNRGAWHPLRQKLGGFLIWVNKSFSTGSVSLESADPDREPRVEFNFLDDERDLRRLTDGLKRLAVMYRHPAMRKAARFPFPTSYSERSRDLAVVRRSTRFRLEPVARCLDGSPSLVRSVMKRRVSGGLSLFEIARDEAELERFVRERAHGTWHCCGTCKMGDASDPLAVTDAAGKVRGVEGLRIADASIMPSIPRANTNIPVIMIAEKLSDAILAAKR